MAGGCVQRAHTQEFCELPTWDDFKLHWSVCFGSFLVLIGVSVLLATCRQSWNAEWVEKLLRPYVRELTTTRSYLAVAAVIAVFMCALHVVRTEVTDPYGNIPRLWNDIEFYACFLHLAEMLLIWLHATAQSSGIGGLPFGRLLVDCAVVPSVLLRKLSTMQSSHFAFSYFASLRVFRLWNCLQSTVGVHRRGVKLQVFNAAVVLTSFTFCAAMLIQQVETLAGAPWPWYQATAWDAKVTQRWSIGSSGYFVIATVTTVGYGDLWPRSVFGQLLAMVIAVVGIWLGLRTALGVLEAAMLGLGGGGFYPKRARNKHVVVVGNPSYQVLCDFIQELYHEDHSQESEDLNLVILFNPGLKSTMAALRQFLNRVEHRHLKSRVWMLSGSAVRRGDLERAAYKDASMAWLLPNLYAADAEREDVENAMRALAMRRHSPYVRIVALTLKVEHRQLMLSVGVPRGDILCADEFKLGLLGKSCQVQGFVSWASILFKNTAILEHLNFGDVRPLWIDDYVAGLANELYEVSLSKSYLGSPFGAIAIDVLARSNGMAFLIGVVEEPTFPGDETVTKIFPGRSSHVGMQQDRHCKGIFVAASREAIRQHPAWKNFAWTLDGAAPSGGADEAREDAGQAGAAGLPNAVPEPLATKGKPGYIKQQIEHEEEKQAAVEKSMSVAARLRAARGLQTRAGFPREEAEALAGAPQGLGRHLLLDAEGAEGAAGLPDGAEGGQDAGAKAIFDQHLKAQAEAQKEDEVLAVEAEIAGELRAMAPYRRAVGMAEQEEEERWRDRAPLPEDQREDDELWGGPPARPRGPFGAPREPPAALLVRGGHILVLALEGGDRDAARDKGGRGFIAGSVLTREKAVRPPGRQMALVQLLRALRSGVPRHRARSVVVLADEVPADWPQAALEGGVYFVVGPPLSGTGLRRGGVQQAHAVVIHQRTSPATIDPSTVDAEAVFACRLVESLVTAAGKDIPVICDLQLERNAFFVPHVQRERQHGKAYVVGVEREGEAKESKDDDDQPQKKIHAEDVRMPFYLQPRFANGQLFVSGVITAAAANMMYNPALASIFQELISAGYIIQPVPPEWKGRTYAELFTYFIRRRNLLAVALLRRLDYDQDLEDNADDAEEKAQLEAAAAVAKPPPERWAPDEIRSGRCVCVMPPGETGVVEHDGVMCILPTSGKGILSSMGSSAWTT